MVEEIPEPHAFTARVRLGQQDYSVIFEEHEHTHDRRIGTTTCVPPLSTSWLMPQCPCL